MGEYDGKTVVITGGTTGIGLATAEYLVAAGARVLVTGRTKARLDAARGKLGSGATVVTVTPPRCLTLTLSQAASRTSSGPSTCCS
jgi:NAD(P)-dependent dehydrogenase (short-subunit alcohol dehydrogenase family)